MFNIWSIKSLYFFLLSLLLLIPEIKLLLHIQTRNAQLFHATYKTLPNSSLSTTTYYRRAIFPLSHSNLVKAFLVKSVSLARTSL